MNVRARLVAIAAGTGLLLGGGLGTAQSASAASGDPGTVLAFSNIYAHPYDWASVQYTTITDAQIPLQCYLDTQDGQGQPWHRWFKLNQSASYVRSDRVDPQPSVPHC